MSAIVCDSCVMQRYTKALINVSGDCVSDVIACVLDKHKLAMDDGRKMENQWLETCGHQVFGELLYMWLREGRIALFSGKLHEQHRKHLVTKCGFPFDQRHEGVFVAVAAEAFPHILVCDDLDFWEPKEKGCPARRRQKLMAEGRGKVCKYLSRELEIRVVPVELALGIICSSVKE